MAADGHRRFDLDLPDSAENAAEFGCAGNDRSRSAFPKARVVVVVQSGLYASIGAKVGPRYRSEKSMTATLVPSMWSNCLLQADYGFWSFAGGSAVLARTDAKPDPVAAHVMRIIE